MKIYVYYKALRDNAVFMGIGTWYKYANRLGIKRKFFRINRKNVIGIRASRPLQILHMDVTIFKPLDNTKVYIYFIVDNFSRTILSWKASVEYSSSIAMTVLKEVIQIHAIMPRISPKQVKSTSNKVFKTLNKIN